MISSLISFDKKRKLDLNFLTLFKLNGIDFTLCISLDGEDAKKFDEKLKGAVLESDLIVILDSVDNKIDLRERIFSTCDVELEENKTALELMEKYFLSRGKVITEKARTLAMLPLNSTVIENGQGLFQGFAFKRQEKCIVYLPPMDVKGEMENISSAISVLTKKRRASETIKLFALSEERVKSAVKSLRKKYRGKLGLSYFEKYGDTTISLFFDDKTPKMSIDDLKRDLIETFKREIYSFENKKLEEVLIESLLEKGKKISFAESFTGGGLSSRLVSVSGASKALYEGIVCYSNGSKQSRVKVNNYTLASYGAVSDETAYEMALGLLSTNNCDIAVASTGIAGPKSDDTNKPVGLTYVSVGGAEGVDVYKHIFSGDRKEITEKGVNAGLFHAIKYLKEKY